MAFRAPIGISDFAKIREQNAYYVDKTGWIERLLTYPNESLLFPRPRRFGKTLNLSTLKHFVEKSDQDKSSLFEGLQIWDSAEARRHFQRHPVIHLSFKDVKAATWRDAYAAIRSVIAQEIARHRPLLESGKLLPETRHRFARMLNEEDDGPLYWRMLADLSRQLADYHGERVFLLIDEYDIPIHAAYTYGYFDEAVLFFRNFLSAGLKDNDSLLRGVLTGVLRIAKESIFSGLNNVDVCSILSSDFATTFGFTQSEVETLANDIGAPGIAEELRRWYDGYRFAGNTIYNPWSVMMYAKRPEDGCRPHWVFTGADDVLQELMLRRGYRVHEEMEVLLARGAVTKTVSEHVVLRDLDKDANAVWNLLLMTGYLTTRQVELVEGELRADLAIPNEEIRYLFRSGLGTWMRIAMGGDDLVDDMLRAMMAGDEIPFGKLLSKLVVNTLSYHDTGGLEPERVYQAFLLGLLVKLEGTHRVRSNRESGYGRYDVALIPTQPGGTGVVFELKRLDTESGETVEEAFDRALTQIERKGDVAEFEAAGAETIRHYGVVSNQLSDSNEFTHEKSRNPPPVLSR